MKSDTASEPRSAIQVIDRMMKLLDILAAHPDPLSLKEIAQTSGLHPSTAHRILNDLVPGHYVDRTEGGRYRLGLRLLELGNIVKGRIDMRETATEFLRGLHRRTGETINLAVRQDDEIIYVDRAFSEYSGMQVIRAVGERAPLHLTSSGKLFLAARGPEAVRRYAERTGLPSRNANSISDLAKLERELEIIRAQGFARDEEELELGVRCLAAGVVDDSGTLVAGLSISAPADRLRDAWLDDLLETASQLSAALGHAPSRRQAG
jgi:DNA-binding IclR family transcriptional regulator